jgi:glycosyltransferase involved in cell wall biosynthesis
MKILYVSQYFPPEIGAPAARVAELARLWARRGHDVSVLTGFPNHPDGTVPPEYRGKLRRLWMRDDRDGVKVYRTWLLPFPNRKSWERMLNYASFWLSATLRGVLLPKPGVVIATSPQLLVGLAGLGIARCKRVPFVFEVRDLWPESLEAVGVSNRKSLLFRTLKQIAALLYRQADSIIVVTPPLKAHLEDDWHIDPARISVVMNGVDETLMLPEVEHSDVIAEFALADRFVVSYVGTLGNAHSVETLIESAAILQRSSPDIFFLLVGAGAERDKLERLIRERSLRNIRLVPPQPRVRVPRILAASHACVVLLKKSELFKTAIPTKMLEMMACGRPVVLGAEGESVALLTRAGAGICVPPEDPGKLAGAIQLLRSDPQLRQRCGKSGAKFIRQEMTRSRTAMQYLDLLSSLTGETQAATTALEATEGSCIS